MNKKMVTWKVPSHDPKERRSEQSNEQKRGEHPNNRSKQS
jgi:hypothetical protein